MDYTLQLEMARIRLAALAVEIEAERAARVWDENKVMRSPDGTFLRWEEGAGNITPVAPEEVTRLEKLRSTTTGKASAQAKRKVIELAKRVDEYKLVEQLILENANYGSQRKVQRIMDNTIQKTIDQLQKTAEFAKIVDREDELAQIPDRFKNAKRAEYALTDAKDAVADVITDPEVQRNTVIALGVVGTALAAVVLHKKVKGINKMVDGIMQDAAKRAVGEEALTRTQAILQRAKQGADAVGKAKDTVMSSVKPLKRMMRNKEVKQAVKDLEQTVKEVSRKGKISPEDLELIAKAQAVVEQKVGIKLVEETKLKDLREIVKEVNQDVGIDETQSVANVVDVIKEKIPEPLQKPAESLGDVIEKASEVHRNNRPKPEGFGKSPVEQKAARQEAYARRKMRRMGLKASAAGDRISDKLASIAVDLSKNRLADQQAKSIIDDIPNFLSELEVEDLKELKDLLNDSEYCGLIQRTLNEYQVKDVQAASDGWAETRVVRRPDGTFLKWEKNMTGDSVHKEVRHLQKKRPGQVKDLPAQTANQAYRDAQDRTARMVKRSAEYQAMIDSIDKFGGSAGGYYRQTLEASINELADQITENREFQKDLQRELRIQYKQEHPGIIKQTADAVVDTVTDTTKSLHDVTSKYIESHPGVQKGIAVGVGVVSLAATMMLLSSPRNRKRLGKIMGRMNKGLEPEVRNLDEVTPPDLATETTRVRVPDDITPNELERSGKQDEKFSDKIVWMRNVPLLKKLVKTANRDRREAASAISRAATTYSKDKAARGLTSKEVSELSSFIQELEQEQAERLTKQQTRKGVKGLLPEGKGGKVDISSAASKPKAAKALANISHDIYQGLHEDAGMEKFSDMVALFNLMAPQLDDMPQDELEKLMKDDDFVKALKRVIGELDEPDVGEMQAAAWNESTINRDPAGRFAEKATSAPNRTTRMPANPPNMAQHVSEVENRQRQQGLSSAKAAQMDKASPAKQKQLKDFAHKKGYPGQQLRDKVVASISESSKTAGNVLKEKISEINEAKDKSFKEMSAKTKQAVSKGSKFLKDNKEEILAGVALAGAAALLTTGVLDVIWACAPATIFIPPEAIPAEFIITDTVINPLPDTIYLSPQGTAWVEETLAAAENELMKQKAIVYFVGQMEILASFKLGVTATELHQNAQHKNKGLFQLEASVLDQTYQALSKASKDLMDSARKNKALIRPEDEHVAIIMGLTWPQFDPLRSRRGAKAIIDTCRREYGMMMKKILESTNLDELKTNLQEAARKQTRFRELAEQLKAL